MSEQLADEPEEAASSDRPKLVVMWILIAAFLLAVPMMFVHPGLTIALFWLGLIIVAASAAIARLFRRSPGRTS
jgi:hypothetical protein